MVWSQLSDALAFKFSHFMLHMYVISVGSQGEYSDGGFSDSSYSRLRTYNRNPVRSNRNNRSANSYMSSPDIVSKITRLCMDQLSNVLKILKTDSKYDIILLLY